MEKEETAVGDENQVWRVGRGQCGGRASEYQSFGLTPLPSHHTALGGFPAYPACRLLQCSLALWKYSLLSRRHWRHRISYSGDIRSLSFKKALKWLCDQLTSLKTMLHDLLLSYRCFCIFSTVPIPPFHRWPTLVDSRPPASQRPHKLSDYYETPPTHLGHMLGFTADVRT